jgi:hypothetical protein
MAIRMKSLSLSPSGTISSVLQVFEPNNISESYYFQSIPRLSPRNNKSDNGNNYKTFSLKNRDLSLHKEREQNLFRECNNAVNAINGIRPASDDDDFSETTQSNYTSLHDSYSIPKVPNYSELQELAKSVADNVSFSTDANKVAVARVLKEIADITIRGVDEDTMQSLDRVYTSYRAERSSGSGQITISDPKPANHEFLRRQPQLRLKSGLEGRTKRSRSSTNNSTTTSKKCADPSSKISSKALCSFCRKPHSGFITSCPTLQGYGKEVIWENFRQNLLLNYPIHTEPKVVRFSSEEEFIYNKPKYHFVLKYLAPKYDIASHLTGNGSKEHELIIVVDLVNKRKDVHDGVLPGNVSKKDVCLLAADFLNKYGSFPRDLKVIDAIEKHSTGTKFRSRKIQNSHGLHRFNEATSTAYPNTFPSYSNINYGSYPQPLYPPMPTNYQLNPLANNDVRYVPNHANMLFAASGTSQQQIPEDHVIAPAGPGAHAQHYENHGMVNYSYNYMQEIAAARTTSNSNATKNEMEDQLKKD